MTNMNKRNGNWKEALVVVIVIATIIFMLPTQRVEDHKWEKCDCFYGYDCYGYYSNQSPFNYHCTVHEDGHNCQ